MSKNSYYCDRVCYYGGMTPLDKEPETGMNGFIAAELRAERSAKQITYDQLSEESGVNRRTLIRLLQAQRSIDVAHMASIASALGLDLVELMERAEGRAEQATGNKFGFSIEDLPAAAGLAPYPEETDWEQPE
ncbi:MAG: helix-turn-helix transcriptional regulator [Actinomycetaceae bacterium]|nr:helix-turn-helix transcriptional regulator [Actinomycetaceae bacterium]